MGADGWIDIYDRQALIDAGLYQRFTSYFCDWYEELVEDNPFLAKDIIHVYDDTSWYHGRSLVVEKDDEFEKELEKYKFATWEVWS